VDKENLRNSSTGEDYFNFFDPTVMNIYESILDLNQTKPTDSSLISSSSNSIGITTNNNS